MNMNVTSIWEEFEKESASFVEIKSLFEFVADKYNISQEEVKELVSVAYQATYDYFGDSKMLKKHPLTKKYDSDSCKLIAEFFINAVFFGMFLIEYLKWDWPNK